MVYRLGFAGHQPIGTDNLPHEWDNTGVMEALGVGSKTMEDGSRGFAAKGVSLSR